MSATLLPGMRSGSGEPFWRCSACSMSFDVRQWGVEHLDEAHAPGRQGAQEAQAAQLSRLKAEMERALWEARREGYEAALVDMDRRLQERFANGDRSVSTQQNQIWIADRIRDNRDERIEKPWLRWQDRSS